MFADSCNTVHKLYLKGNTLKLSNVHQIYFGKTIWYGVFRSDLIEYHKQK